MKFVREKGKKSQGFLGRLIASIEEALKIKNIKEEIDKTIDELYEKAYVVEFNYDDEELIIKDEKERPIKKIDMTPQELEAVEDFIYSQNLDLSGEIERNIVFPELDFAEISYELDFAEPNTKPARVEPYLRIMIKADPSRVTFADAKRLLKEGVIADIHDYKLEDDTAKINIITDAVCEGVEGQWVLVPKEAVREIENFIRELKGELV